MLLVFALKGNFIVVFLLLSSKAREASLDSSLERA